MDRAINKKTGRLINAFEVYKNGSYQNLNKGEWIAPKDSLYNWEEIEESDSYVHYVKEKEFTNFNGTRIWCSPHFAIYPNSKAKTVEESKEHRMLKNWVFNRLMNDDLEIIYSKGTKPHKYENKIKLSELDINWNDYEIEVTTKGTKYLRADIMLPFNKKDSFLGKGIFFEIQISNQTKEQTFERSILRCLHGYSICWLFKKDFIIKEDNIELKNNKLMINSFSEQLHFAKKGFVKRLKITVEEQCRFLDDKLKETDYYIDLLEDKKEKLLNDLKKEGENIISLIQKKLNTREELLIHKIETMENNPFKGIIDTYKGELNNEKEKIIDNISHNQYLLNESYKIMKEKLNYPLTFGECKKCHLGYMHYKITRTGKEVYGCNNYPGCQNTIWLTKIKEDSNGNI